MAVEIVDVSFSVILDMPELLLFVDCAAVGLCCFVQLYHVWIVSLLVAFGVSAVWGEPSC